MNIKRNLLAVLVPLALGVSLPAQAVFTSSFSGAHEAKESGTEFLTTAGSFAGMFNFSLSTASIVSYTGFTNLAPFLGFGLFSSAGALVSGTFFTPTSFQQTTTTSTLAAGNYYYAPIFPTSGPAFTIYSFESTATAIPAIPEPEAFLMLLAGLGIVGTIAGRRSKS